MQNGKILNKMISLHFQFSVIGKTRWMRNAVEPTYCSLYSYLNLILVLLLYISYARSCTSKVYDMQIDVQTLPAIDEITEGLIEKYSNVHYSSRTESQNKTFDSHFNIILTSS